MEEVLDALSAASGGRFRGIRGVANWDADPSINTGSRPFGPPGLLSDIRFRAGFARLAAQGQVYDAFQYYPQVPELCGLADAFPEATIVVNHCGGLLGIGPYARPDNFAHWKERVGEIAKRPNALMKLGGLAGRRCGLRLRIAQRLQPRRSLLPFGALISKLASNYSAPIAACSRATCRPTTRPAATSPCGTYSS